MIDYSLSLSLPLTRLPRLASSQVQLTTYHAWMSRGAWLDRPGYLFLRLRYRRQYLFCSLQTCRHPLGIVTGRWQDIPRFERICRRCDMHALDDERHLVFECPVFEDLRSAYRCVFGPEVGFDMRRFFAQDNQRGVVLYILGCLHVLERVYS